MGILLPIKYGYFITLVYYLLLIKNLYYLFDIEKKALKAVLISYLMFNHQNYPCNLCYVSHPIQTNWIWVHY